MNKEERRYAAIVINYFWGEDTTTPEAVTEKAVIVAFKALENAKACSRSMDLIPRPQYGAINGLRYALMQITMIGIRIENGNVRPYIACKNVIQGSYKTDIFCALSGDC